MVHARVIIYVDLDFILFYKILVGTKIIIKNELIIVVSILGDVKERMGLV